MGVGSLLENGQPLVPGIPKVLLWWFALAAVGAFVLAKTRYGNWILAVGGDANAAKNVGVPVRRVKINGTVIWLHRPPSHGSPRVGVTWLRNHSPVSATAHSFS